MQPWAELPSSQAEQEGQCKSRGWVSLGPRTLRNMHWREVKGEALESEKQDRKQRPLPSVPPTQPMALHLEVTSESVLSWVSP